MRIFKFWQTAEMRLMIDGVEKTITCFGGSNTSESDAVKDGQTRLEAVRKRIEGKGGKKDRHYEADIREEPLEWIGNQDVVTRNRYGAEVLNSNSLIFVDIDEPVFRFWEIFRRIKTREQKKENILAFLARRFQKPDIRNYGIRVYETHSGIRLLLEGKNLQPGSPESQHLMRSFHADKLYAALCIKQNCYRARLTPKPYRIKIQTIRVKYPYKAQDQANLEKWIREYNIKSQRFATCRLIQTLGRSSMSSAILYHDEKTRAQSNLPLA